MSEEQPQKRQRPDWPRKRKKLRQARNKAVKTARRIEACDELLDSVELTDAERAEIEALHQQLTGDSFAVEQTFARIAPRKCRLVANMVRGRSVNESLDMLTYTHNKGARIIEKLIKSSVANASDSGFLDVNELEVRDIRIDEGPVIKRWRPRARGRACPIHKRTSHIRLIVAPTAEYAAEQAAAAAAE